MPHGFRVFKTLLVIVFVGVTQAVSAQMPGTAPFAFMAAKSVSPNGGTTGPCSGVNPGQACASTPALFVGKLNGNHYMTTPSGCDGTTSNPTCSGAMDGAALKFVWSSSTSINVPETPDFANPTTTPDSADGAVESAAVSASVAGDNSAADYCEALVYGGFNDWYLPNKTEMALMYCRSQAPNHNSSRPEEDPNCANFNSGQTGPSGDLTGFFSSFPSSENTSTDLYWTVSEKNGSSAHAQSFSLGSQSTKGKNVAYYARCVRKY